MKNRVIPVSVIFLVLFALSVLFGFAYEEWDGLCGHKKEFGFFPFYRVGTPTDPSGECSTGVIVKGAIQTSAALLFLTIFAFSARRKLKRRSGASSGT
ncbi:hypothetical protein ACNKU7_18680 [Microbulbifer sp. SA54]|uniref:hypothetical protein n=1 Tax=Microbulbifer sp. SA54 TaxID=3401577 RepID=UPI003AADADE4